MPRFKRKESREHREIVLIRVDGQPVTAYRGDTAAAVLLLLGKTAFRESKARKEPRGVYCGMGICQECLITVNGQPGVRACRTYIEEDLEIETPGARL